ncbi:hypothetical protein CONLIGDRAFT_677935 [Coniochaeta ligniaria NRRL 30616]|uniref:CCHC-type domain-containing protein n=1 Tax=Coniochaeta ligniaria NRRL 30616 TaxID=1408157 RepID=A0A1J7IVF1_9PEZI|nr:hypothetical protein CONLIGDRAFT_677935 [Coniochaeta ligniaria NRRL 30616]
MADSNNPGGGGDFEGWASFSRGRRRKYGKRAPAQQVEGLEAANGKAVIENTLYVKTAGGGYSEARGDAVAGVAASVAAGVAVAGRKRDRSPEYYEGDATIAVSQGGGFDILDAENRRVTKKARAMVPIDDHGQPNTVYAGANMDDSSASNLLNAALRASRTGKVDIAVKPVLEPSVERYTLAQAALDDGGARESIVRQMQTLRPLGGVPGFGTGRGSRRRARRRGGGGDGSGGGGGDGGGIGGGDGGDGGDGAAATHARAELKCPNCGRAGHKLVSCIKASAETGEVSGCAKCNALGHETDECPDFEGETSRARLDQLYHFYIKRRAAIPPLAWTDKYCWPAYAAVFGSEGGYPMTPEDGKRFMATEDAAQRWETWDYTHGGQRGLQKGLVSSLKDNASVVKFVLGNARYVRHYETLTTEAQQERAREQRARAQRNEFDPMDTDDADAARDVSLIQRSEYYPEARSNGPDWFSNDPK